MMVVSIFSRISPKPDPPAQNLGADTGGRAAWLGAMDTFTVLAARQQCAECSIES